MKARDRGNSVFIDENLTPYEDRWAFLSGVKKISRQEIETIVLKAESKGRIIGAHLNLIDEDNDTPMEKTIYF